LSASRFVRSRERTPLPNTSVISDCREAHKHRHSHRHTDTQTHRHTDTQTPTHTHTHTHKC
jgi:hypothetical protein